MLARRLFGVDAPALLAFALTTVVGGFDIVPMLMLGQQAITLDTWADTLVRIHSLLTQMVWTPQNVQGATIVLLGAFLLSEHGMSSIWLLLGPLLGASLIGTTIWLGAAVFPALALLVLLELARLRRPAGWLLMRLIGAAFVAAAIFALSLPTLRGYLEMSHRHGKSLTTCWPQQSHALLGRIAPPGVLANLLDLPWTLLIEFGPLLVLPLLLPRATWRRIWHDPGVRLLLLATLIALAGFVTLRSHFTYNDFGQKIIMAAMICGAVIGGGSIAPGRAGCDGAAWNDSANSELPPAARTYPTNAAYAHPAMPRWKTVVVGAALILGSPVALWQSPLAAIRRFVPPDGPLARISVALLPDDAAAIRFLRDGLTSDAVIQAHPGPERLTLQQLACRQIGAMPLEQDTHVFLGRDPARQETACAELLAELTSGRSAARLQERLNRLGVTHVFVGQVERENWSQLERFNDESSFARLFSSGATRIFEVR
jgi:hypothetical protein